MPVHAKFDNGQIENGGNLFLQNCAFCHGKDAGGGETGPDLTRSKLVSSDRDGEKISEVLHGSRVQKGMPRFDLPDTQILAENPGQGQVADYDAIVIGAGISGMCMLYRLRQLGMTARVFEAV